MGEVRARQPTRPDRRAGRHPGVGAQVGDLQRFAGRLHDAGEAVRDRGVGDLGPGQRQVPPAVQPQPVALHQLDQDAGGMGRAGGERGKLIGGAAGQHAAVQLVRGGTAGRVAGRTSPPGTGAGALSTHADLPFHSLKLTKR
jgi:hypothetical protein